MKKPDISIILGLGKPSASSRPPLFSKPKSQEANPEGGIVDPIVTREPEPEMEEAASSLVIPPESVCFRAAEETCGNCSHMGADGQCAALKIAVNAGDGCNLFAMREPGANEMERAAETEAPPEISA